MFFPIDQDSNTLLGLELTWFVLVAVSSILVICACTVGIAICLCRRSTRNVGNNIQSKVMWFNFFFLRI